MKRTVPSRPRRLPDDAATARSVVLVWVDGMGTAPFRAVFDREGLVVFEKAFAACQEEGHAPPVLRIHQFGARDRGAPLYSYPIATRRIITFCEVPPMTAAEREWMGVPEPAPPPAPPAHTPPAAPALAKPEIVRSADPNDAPPPPKPDATLQ